MVGEAFGGHRTPAPTVGEAAGFAGAGLAGAAGRAAVNRMNRPPAHPQPQQPHVVPGMPVPGGPPQAMRPPTHTQPVVPASRPGTGAPRPDPAQALRPNAQAPAMPSMPSQSPPLPPPHTAPSPEHFRIGTPSPNRSEPGMDFHFTQQNLQQRLPIKGRDRIAEDNQARAEEETRIRMELQRQSRQQHLDRLRATVSQQSSADLAAQRLREQQQRSSGWSEPQAPAVAHPQSGSVRQRINDSARQGRSSSPQASSPNGATPRGRRTNRTQNFFADNADDALEHALQNRHHDNATLQKLRQIRAEKQGVAGVSGGSSAPVVAPPGGWAGASERSRPGRREFDPPLRKDKTRSPHEQQQLTNRIRGGQPDIIDDSRGELTKAQRHRLDQAEKDHEEDVAMAAAR